MEHRATCTRSQGRQGCRAHDDDDSIDCSMVVDLSSSERALVLDLRASRFRLDSSSLSCSISTSSQRQEQEEQEVPNDVIDTICGHINAAQTHERDASFLRQSCTYQCSTRSFLNESCESSIDRDTRARYEREREPHKISLSLSLSRCCSLPLPRSHLLPPFLPLAIISLLAIECVWTTTILDLVAVEYHCTFDLI